MRRDLITVVLLLAGTACGGARSGTSASAGSTGPATFTRYDARAVAGGSAPAAGPAPKVGGSTTAATQDSASTPAPASQGNGRSSPTAGRGGQVS